MPFSSRSADYQPMVLVVVCLLLGVVVGDVVSCSPWFLLSLWSLVLAAWWLVARRSPRGGTVLALVLIVTTGGLLQTHRLRWQPSHHVSAWVSEEARPAVLIGVVRELPQRVRTEPQPWQADDPVWRYNLGLRHLRRADGWTECCGMIEVWQRGREPLILPGDRCRLTGLLSRPPAPRNPGEADRQGRLARRGVWAQLSVSSGAAVQVVGHEWAFPQRGLSAWRRGADQRLGRYLQGDALALSRAFSLGLRDQLSDETRQRFQEAGISHLLAISGFHVGLLFLLLFTPAVHLGAKRGAVRWLLAGVIVAYAGLSGLSPSVLRAASCVVLILLAQSRGRSPGMMSLLGLVAAGMVAGNTAVCFDVAAQLSFLGVFLLSHAVIPACGETRQWCRRRVLSRTSWSGRVLLVILAGLIQVQWATLLVVLGTQPLVAFHFHRVAWAALLINPVAVFPTAGVLAASLLLLVPGLGDLLAPALVPTINTGVALLDGLADVGRTVVPSSAVMGPAAWLLAGGYLGLLFMELWRHNGGPRGGAVVWLVVWNLAMVAETRLLPMLLTRDAAGRTARITVIDVGHGTAVLLEGVGGETWLYDAGSAGGGERAARTISQVLWQRRIGRLDRVFLSHPDRDHFNAIESLLDRHEIVEVVVPVAFQGHADVYWQRTLAACRRHQVKVSYCQAGDRYPADAPRVCQVLHPPPRADRWNDNEASLVLVIELGGTRVLLTGDLEGPAGLAVARRAPQCDLLLAPHHGGVSSSPQAWIAHVRPKWVCISAAHDCPWLRDDDLPPARPVVNVFNTATHGAVMFQWDAGRCQVTTFRKRNRLAEAGMQN